MKRLLPLTVLLLATCSVYGANAGSFRVANGSTFTLSSANYTVLKVTGSVIIDGNLNAGSADIKVTDKWLNNGSFTAGTSTVTFYTTAISTLTGQTTFYCLNIRSGGKEVDFTAGTTQWITATLKVTGAPGNLISLRSTVPNNKWALTCNSTNTVNYADIEDSDANLFPFNCQNSSDSGNLNADWIFTPDKPINLEQINGSGVSLYSMQWSTSQVAVSSFTQSTPNPLNTVKYYLQVTSATAGTAADWSQLWLSSASALISQGTTGYLWPKLIDSATYWWRVWSENSLGATSSTQTFLATLPGNTTACFIYSPLILDVAPANFTGVALTTHSIEWSWDDVAAEMGFRVRYSTAPAGPPASPSLAAHTLNWTEDGLSANTPYYMVVVATNSASESPLSNAATVYTLANPPADLTFTVVGTSSITFNWTSDNPGYTEFGVAESTDSSFTVAVTTFVTYASGLTENTTSTFALYSNMTYYLRVWAYNGDQMQTAYIQSSTTTKVCLPAPISNFIAMSTYTTTGKVVNLSWTNPTTYYQGVLIVYSTDTAPVFNPVANTTYLEGNKIGNATVLLTGNATSYIQGNVLPSTTYYYAAYAYAQGFYYNSTVSSTSAITPSVTLITTFAATPLSGSFAKEIQLTWSKTGDADYKGVVIVYSTGTSSSFNPTATINYSTGSYDGHIIYNGTGTSYTHLNLTPYVKYYYTAYAYDVKSYYALGTTTAAVALPVPPMEPRGVRAELLANGKTITISWDAVTMSSDSTPASDLDHYTCYCSTTADYTGIISSWSMPMPVTSTTTYTGGLVYYYWLTCTDTSENESKKSAIVETSADMNMIFAQEDDPRTYISIPQSMNSQLYKESNSYGDDIYFDIVHLTSEESGKTLKSYAFVPKKVTTGEVITGLLFPRALATVSISYDVSGGFVSAPSLAPVNANNATDNLALFWFNGVEWIKVGGNVNMGQQTVSVKTKTYGKYQLRVSEKATGFTLDKVYPRIFTPNGDGWNDVVNFIFEGNTGAVVGKIYDVNGAFIADLSKDINDTSLKWDGKNTSGQVVKSGVYIYQIQSGKKVINGTIVLAR